MARNRDKRPTFYVITGANVAGKTTFANELFHTQLPCREFLNADLIAAGLSPFAAETQNRRAGRLLLERFDELAKKKESFAIESTLAGIAYRRRFLRLKEQGYRIAMFYLWLPTADIAVNRVKNRVKQGGHHIPETDIRVRYAKGLYNFFHEYSVLADDWWLYNVANDLPRIIAECYDGNLQYKNESLFQQIKKKLVCFEKMIQRSPKPDEIAQAAEKAAEAVSLRVREIAQRTNTPIISWDEEKQCIKYGYVSPNTDEVTIRWTTARESSA